MKKIALFLFIICISCKEERMIVFHKTGINDYKFFPSRNIGSGTSSYSYYNPQNYKMNYKIDSVDLKYNNLLQSTQTVAFLVIKNDTLLYEKYFDGYQRSSIVPSFSIAKTFTSALIGCAIHDHLIQSVNQPITDFIPDLDSSFSKVTINHLLQMTSGIKFEKFLANTFMEDANLYYTGNLRKTIARLKLRYPPGTHFQYNCGNTFLLGLVLEKALNGKTVSNYLQEKIWEPLQMEYNASWSIDNKKSGLEKTFCCINATAIDYAKFGALYLKKGNWGGNQIISPEWVASSLTPDSLGISGTYNYQWWLINKNAFAAVGLYGQYIYVNPEKNTIIVRLGKRKKSNEWFNFFNCIANNL